MNITKRVTVVQEQGFYYVTVLIDENGHVRYVGCGENKSVQTKHAADIRKAMRFLARDMRKRCAEVAAKHADECVADAIRELEL